MFRDMLAALTTEMKGCWAISEADEKYWLEIHFQSLVPLCLFSKRAPTFQTEIA